MWVFILLVVFLNNALLGIAQRTPTISHISEEQIKDVGETMELECSVQDVQEYPVVWWKVNRDRSQQPLPLSTGSSLIIPDGRFSLRYDAASSTYTIQVKDIQETDAGYYQCQVIIALNNKIQAEVDVRVRRPPVTSANVSEGQQAAGDSGV